MKLFAADAENLVVESEASEALAKNSAFIPIVANGAIELGGTPYRYIVRAFVDGRRLSELIRAGKRYSWEEAAPIILQVLMALKQLHSQEPDVIHNDITARNILIKEDGENTKVFIIGLGHLSHRCNGKATFCTKDLNNWYRAPETFKGM